MTVNLKQARTCFSCEHFQSGKAGCKAYTCFYGTCSLHNVESMCGGTLLCDEEFLDEGSLTEVQAVSRYCDDWEARK